MDGTLSYVYKTLVKIFLKENPLLQPLGIESATSQALLVLVGGAVMQT